MCLLIMHQESYHASNLQSYTGSADITTNYNGLLGLQLAHSLKVPVKFGLVLASVMITILLLLEGVARLTPDLQVNHPYIPATLVIYP